MAEIGDIVDIVDDDLAVRESLSALIDSMGLECHTYSSAEEFLQRPRDYQSSCIVADLRLPGMTGFDLLDSIVTQVDPVPMIIMSGFATVPLAVQLMRRGAFTVMEKPCRPQEIWESIRQAVIFHRATRTQRKEKLELQARFNMLTNSERAVGAGIANGIPNAVLAERLKLGLRTVEKRRQQVFRKLRVDSLPKLISVYFHLTPSLLESQSAETA